MTAITVRERRRTHGEGSIYRRKDGRWEGRAAIGGIRRSFYGETRRDVSQQLQRALADQQRGLLPTSGSATVGQFMERWLEQHGTRASTSQAYRSYTRNHIAPAIGEIPLSKLAPAHVQKMLGELLEDGLSPRTVHHIRAILRTALARALKWGLVAQNVAALSDPPKVERYQPFFLDQDQARTFLAAAAGDRLEALYSCALAVGMREGEALGLRWDDVDLDRGTIRIRHGLQRVPGKGLQAIETKTERSRRTIDELSELVAPALRAHRTRQLQERLLAGARWRDTGFVFVSTIGTPLSASNVIARSFHPLRERAGFPLLRFHDLRHSCASLLLAQGVPDWMVMRLLGHSNIAMTIDTYGHIRPGALRDAARAMDRALGVS